PSDHSDTMALCAGFFGEPLFREAGRSLAPAVPWLLGQRGMQAWKDADAISRPKSRYFSAGGFVVVREEDNYLFMDVGEVGLRGRGGHGHNDILSFELCIGGAPVVVDPGS